MLLHVFLVLRATTLHHSEVKATQRKVLSHIRWGQVSCPFPSGTTDDQQCAVARLDWNNVHYVISALYRRSSPSDGLKWLMMEQTCSSGLPRLPPKPVLFKLMLSLDRSRGFWWQIRCFRFESLWLDVFELAVLWFVKQPHVRNCPLALELLLPGQRHE